MRRGAGGHVGPALLLRAVIAVASGCAIFGGDIADADMRVAYRVVHDSKC